jgi:ABC-type polysaccharide/polyol phosphate export permease
MQTAQHMLRTGNRGAMQEYGLAFADLKTSLRRLGLARSLAWHDIVSRYRGSILGPFWITLSMGLMVLGIGVLYSRLFHVAVQEFIPFVALGIVSWGLITGTILEGCETFVMARGMLSQTSLPMFTFVWRTVLRNLINLAHHAVIIVAVLAWYGVSPRINLPLALVGLVLVLLNISWISMLAAITSARFRDVPQIVGSVMQFAIFMTPVFWKPDSIRSNHAVLVFNPFYYMLESIRTPVLGGVTAHHTYAILVIMAVAGWIITFATFARTRRRIVHYL